MDKSGLGKILIIAFGIVLTVFLFAIGKNRDTALVAEQAVFTESEPIDAWDQNLNGLVVDLLKNDSIDGELKELHLQLAKDENNALLEQVASKWETAGYALIAGYYYEKLAIRDSTENSWQKAANNLFNIVGQFKDTAVKAAVAAHTVNALRQVISRNPDNLDANADLAYCMLENNLGMPMAAISMLTSNLEKDSTNRKSLFYYGNALYKIGSLEGSQARLSKCASMFEKLTRLEPENPIYYQYLAQVQRTMGNNRDAIKSYERHAELLNNEEAKRETYQVIKQIQEEL